MKPYLDDTDFTLYVGDALEVLRELPDESVDCVVTSPPYWGLRDYGTGEWEGGNPDCDHKAPPQGGPTSGPLVGTGHREQGKDVGYRDTCGKCGAQRVDQQLGLEPTPDAYVTRMVEVFREVRRVLAAHGSCWVNLGSSYASGLSLQPRHAPACDSDGTAPQDSRATGSAYRDLCDGCQAATQTRHGRTADTSQLRELDGPLHEPTNRDSGTAGSSLAASGDAPPGAQESTNQRSSEPPQAECSHCANCGACLSVLRSSARDARLCARKERSTNGTFERSPSSADRRTGTESSALAYLYSSIASRQLKPKDDVGIPWLVALALQMDGWYLRSEIVWSKLNPMPESVTDRPTKAHEQIFLLTRQPRYWFDQEAVREPHSRDWSGQAGLIGDGKSRWAEQAGRNDYNGRAAPPQLNPAGRNVRSVWEIATQPYPEAHFATFPEELARRCILAGCAAEVCRQCRKPRERIVESRSLSRPDLPRDHPEWRPSRYDSGKAGDPQSPGPGQRFSEVTTVGWSDCGCRVCPTTTGCDCDGECVKTDYRPGVVLDPFLGSGTTALVARNHGRHAIGIELSAEYAELAAKRTRQLSLLTEGAA